MLDFVTLQLYGKYTLHFINCIKLLSLCSDSEPGT